MKKLITSSVLALATVGFMSVASAGETTTPVVANAKGQWTSKARVMKAAQALRTEAKLMRTLVNGKKKFKNLKVIALRTHLQSKELHQAVKGNKPYWRVRYEFIRTQSLVRRLGRRVEWQGKAPALKQQMRQLTRKTIRTNYNISPQPIADNAKDLHLALKDLRVETKATFGGGGALADVKAAAGTAHVLRALTKDQAGILMVRQEYKFLTEQLEDMKASLAGNGFQTAQIRHEYRAVRQAYRRLSKSLMLEASDLGPLAGGGWN